MPTIVMTKGLPASGKSTWSKEQVNAGGGVIKRVNKDDLRSMLDNGRFSRANERGIILARNSLIRIFTDGGLDVIVDDTNLNPEMELGIRREFPHCSIQIQDFTHVPLEVCIERDALRKGRARVGEQAIMNMYNKWLKE